MTLIESAPVHRLPTGSYVCSSPPVTSASHSRVSLSAFHAEDVQRSSRISTAATLPAASMCNSVCEITDSESSPVDTHNGDEAPAIWCSSSKSRNYPHPSSFDYGVPRLPTNQIFLPTEPHSLPGFRPDPYHFYRYPPTNNALPFSPFHQLTNRDVLSNTADRYWMPRGSTPFAEPKITRRYERRCVKNPYYDYKSMDAFSYTHYMARRPCPPPPSHFIDTTRLNPLYSDLMNTSDHRIVLSNRNSNTGHEVLSNRSRDTRRGHFT
ncbi:unnamed protein product [Dicrocoelium dendriticum]|nr:unnamed protein product [Dicrocoelium dendriticum]